VELIAETAMKIGRKVKLMDLTKENLAILDQEYSAEFKK
jgi:hypothetical protein